MRAPLLPVFVAFAEWAESVGVPLLRGIEVVRPLGTALGDDDPAANDRIFTQVWHSG